MQQTKRDELELETRLDYSRLIVKLLYRIEKHDSATSSADDDGAAVVRRGAGGCVQRGQLLLPRLRYDDGARVARRRAHGGADLVAAHGRRAGERLAPTAAAPSGMG